MSAMSIEFLGIAEITKCACMLREAISEIVNSYFELTVHIAKLDAQGLYEFLPH
jgi:hypothetical protein